MDPQRTPPVVLVLAGHDPCGGAGIQADIEAIGAQGCHATTALTCLTVQDSSRVHSVHPVEAELFLRQARQVAEDMPPAAIKIGLVPDARIARAIGELLDLLPSIPVVLDPVLHAGDGRPLAAVQWLQPLLARSTLATPNRREARLLSGETSEARAADILLTAGAGAVLVTGADEAHSRRVVNTLYQAGSRVHWQWPRLPGSYHGSGCTLAAAIAARLALDEPLQTAVEKAQAYTQDALRAAIAPGKGQRIPRRSRHHRPPRPILE